MSDSEKFELTELETTLCFQIEKDLGPAIGPTVSRAVESALRTAYTRGKLDGILEVRLDQ